MEQLSGLFGMSRQGMYKWLHGDGVRMAHREHVLEVSTLLDEAKERMGDTLTNWLLTPVLPGGKKPVDLLRERDYTTFRGFLFHERTRLRPPATREETEEEAYWATGCILPDEFQPKCG